MPRRVSEVTGPQIEILRRLAAGELLCWKMDAGVGPAYSMAGAVIRASTVKRLIESRWIARVDNNYPLTFFGITKAGREALGRL